MLEHNYAEGCKWSDISEHLPFLRSEAHGYVLEIGVRGGISTSALLLGLKEHEHEGTHSGHLWSVDIASCGHLYDDPDWTFLHAHSVVDAKRILASIPSELDVFFLDSSHDLEETRSELKIYAPLVREGGKILCHDVDLAGAGVRQALEEYAASIGKQPSYHTGSFGLGILVP
jgi:predicted O-methyltransferase YrrM